MKPACTLATLCGDSERVVTRYKKTTSSADRSLVPVVTWHENHPVDSRLSRKRTPYMPRHRPYPGGLDLDPNDLAAVRGYPRDRVLSCLADDEWVVICCFLSHTENVKAPDGQLVSHNASTTQRSQQHQHQHQWGTRTRTLSGGSQSWRVRLPHGRPPSTVATRTDSGGPA